MKKYIALDSGYIRPCGWFEFNWNLQSWVLPLSIEFTRHYLFIGILCFTLIFTKNTNE